MDSKLTIRPLRRNDVGTIVKMHLREMSPDDLSVALGPKAVTTFYEALTTAEEGRTLVAENEGRIVALSTVFWDYDRFHGRIRLPLLRAVGLSVLSPKILSGIVRRLVFKNPLPSSLRRYHLGLIIRSTEVDRDLSSGAFQQVYASSADLLREQGAREFWGATRTNNIRAIKFLERERFRRSGERDGIVYFVRSI